MTQVFTSLEAIPWEKVTPEYTRRSLVGEKCMVTWVKMPAGAVAKAHHHPQEQIFWVTMGRIAIRIGDKVQLCGPGDLARVPPNVEHDTRCEADTEFITFQAPPRTDLLPGTAPPPHLRKF